MFSKINNILRVIFMIFGGLFVLAGLIDSQSAKLEAVEEDFQTKEFDDIW